MENLIMIIFNYVINKKILFCFFFSFQNLPILKNSIMIIFNYVIANFLFVFFCFKISQYFKTSQFWKIQSWSSSIMSLKTFYFLWFFYFKTSQFWKIQSWESLTMTLQTFYFRFSIFKYLNILKLPNFGKYNHDHF